MDSNEEYLDQLLKSLTGEDSSGAAGGTDDLDQDDGLGDLLNQFSDDMDSVPGDLLSGLLGSPENLPEEPSHIAQEDEAEDESATLSDMLQDMAGEDEPEEAVDILTEMPSEESIEDAIEQQPAFAESEQAAFEAPETSDSELTEDFGPATVELSADDMEEDDLGSLLDSLGADGDEDAQEISNLLDMAERDEPVDNVVDSLMQGLNQEVSQEEGYSGDDFLGEDAIEELLGSQGKKKKKKEKKPRRSKKKKGLQEIAVDMPEDATELSEDNTDLSQQETGNESAGGEKKQGFWGKLLNALTQEEEEEEDPSDLVSDENGEILKELDKEKKQAKGKKKRIPPTPSRKRRNKRRTQRRKRRRFPLRNCLPERNCP